MEIFNRLNYLPDSRLVAETFSLTKNKSYNLFSKVNDIVNEKTGLSMTQDIFPKKTKCKYLFSQLRDAFYDFACDKGMGEVRDVNNKSKLRTYKTFKSYLKAENYLHCISNLKIRYSVEIILSFEVRFKGLICP